MMKFRYLCLLMSFMVSGCAIPLKIESISNAASQKQFQGIDSETKFSISFPSSHSGPYKSVEQFNFTVIEGQYKDKNVSALLAKSRKTGAWEVLRILVEEKDEWVRLPENRLIRLE